MKPSRFYSQLFGAEPAKRRPGYANFAIAEPPLKLVLLENPGQGGSLNHLGVEVARHRHGRRRAGPAGRGRAAPRSTSATTTCCYAKQDKFWVQGTPDGESWEIYTVLDDSQTFYAEDPEASLLRHRHQPAGAHLGRIRRRPREPAGSARPTPWARTMGRRAQRPTWACRWDACVLAGASRAPTVPARQGRASSRPRYRAATSYVPLPAQIQQLAQTMLKQVTGPSGNTPAGFSTSEPRNRSTQGHNLPADQLTTWGQGIAR